MKPGRSSLNPYASSYIPLPKREKKPCATAKHNSTMDDSSPSRGNTEPKTGSPKPSQPFSPKDSRKAHKREDCLVDDSEVEVAYLATIFPHFSRQSLAGIYSVTGGDIDNSIDMLTQLMHDDGDISSQLPDSLDIGDVSESKFLPTFSSMNQETDEASEVSCSSPQLRGKKSDGV